MIVTINTDASYSKYHKIGAFAFWIVSDKGRICHSGAFKSAVRGPNEAEMMCIINAMHTLKKQGYNNIRKIIINTDSLNSIHVFTPDCQAISKYKLQWAKPLRKKYNKILFTIGIGCKVEFRHIRSHMDTLTPRAWVNQWLDDAAGRHLVEKIKLISK